MNVAIPAIGQRAYPIEPGDTTARKPHIEALTGLRFFAAINIVAYHFGQSLFGTAPAWLATIVSHGRESVGLFFVLSGFVLAYAYLDNSGEPYIARKSFWIARLARIYPVYLFSMVLTAIIMIFQLAQSNPPSVVIDKTAQVAAVTLPMIQAWLPFAENWNYPSWALSVELFFYLVFPFLGIWLGRLSRRNLILAMIVLYAANVAAPLAQSWIGTVFGSSGAGLIPQGQEWRLDGLPILNLPMFLIGVGLGRLYVLQAANFTIVDSARKIRGWVISSFGAIATLVTLAGCSFYNVPLYTLFIPAFALLIYGLAHGSGPIAWTISRPAIVLLGEASYSIYILQFPVWQWTTTLVQAIDANGTSSGTFFLFYIISLIICSIATLYLIEKPARNTIRRLFGD